MLVNMRAFADTVRTVTCCQLAEMQSRPHKSTLVAALHHSYRWRLAVCMRADLLLPQFLSPRIDASCERDCLSDLHRLDRRSSNRMCCRSCIRMFHVAMRDVVNLLGVARSHMQRRKSERKPGARGAARTGNPTRPGWTCPLAQMAGAMWPGRARDVDGIICRMPFSGSSCANVRSSHLTVSRS